MHNFFKLVLMWGLSINLANASPEFVETEKVFDHAKVKKRHYPLLNSTQETIQEPFHLSEICSVFPSHDQKASWIMVSTDEQTQGRGYWERSWFSPKGNVFVTYGIPAPLDDTAFMGILSRIPCIAGTAVTDTLAEFGIRARLRWVNNVLVGDKKIAGILVNPIFGREKILLIGIGINVDLSSEACHEIDQPATSVNLITGKKIMPETVLEKLTENIYNHFNVQSLKPAVFDKTFERYQQMLAYMGQTVEVFDGEERIKGVFKGVNEYGYLILETGRDIKLFPSGEISPQK